MNKKGGMNNGLKSELNTRVQIISTSLVNVKKEVEKLADKNEKSCSISLLDACTCTGNCNNDIVLTR